MVNIQKVDHVGIRVTDKDKATKFYEKLGFKIVAPVTDEGFKNGFPVIIEHESGVVLNLLGPGIKDPKGNVLMDVDTKYVGITHISFRVPSLQEVRDYFEKEDIVVTESFQYKGLKALFIRDLDGNVLEFDEYEGHEPDTRTNEIEENVDGYKSHPN